VSFMPTLHNRVILCRIQRTMLLTPHTFVGMAVAVSVPNPYIAVPLSFVLHFFGDKVPHWDFFSNTRVEERLKGWRIFAVMADFGLAIAAGLTLTFYALWALQNSALALNIFLCCFASTLPDALEAPHLYFGISDPVTRGLTKIQHKMQFQAPLPWGIISQLVVIGFCLVLLADSLLQV